MTQTKKLHAYALSLTIHEVLAQLLPDERKIIAAIARCDGIRPEEFTVQDMLGITTKSDFVFTQPRPDSEVAPQSSDTAVNSQGLHLEK
jgi:hypothetical protein